MGSRTTVKYVAYNLRTYFSRQPEDIKHCPSCGELPSVQSIQPSKVVFNYLASASMPWHNFSYLYQCGTCQWWAIREGWGDHECCSHEFDYLIVCETEGIEGANKQVPSWRRALKHKNIYNNEMPLPNTLGLLFQDGKKKK